MLVLSRQREQEIIIEVPPCAVVQKISVVVVDIRGDKVRLGIEAPKPCPVHRLEVYQEVCREREKVVVGG